MGSRGLGSKVSGLWVGSSKGVCTGNKRRREDTKESLSSEEIPTFRLMSGQTGGRRVPVESEVTSAPSSRFPYPLHPDGRSSEGEGILGQS